MKQCYAPEIEVRTLTTIFRPDRRLFEEDHPQALYVGQEAFLRVLEKVGAPWAGILGQPFPGIRVPVLIRGVEAIQYKDLKPEDFVGSSSDIQDATSLRTQIKLIYNKTMAEICDNAWVTRTTFIYLADPTKPTMSG